VGRLSPHLAPLGFRQPAQPTRGVMADAPAGVVYLGRWRHGPGTSWAGDGRGRFIVEPRQERGQAPYGETGHNRRQDRGG
jgi:hypothetical protein